MATEETRIEKKQAISTMGKRRYNEIRKVLEDLFGERAEEALCQIREIMKFDPEESTYTKEKGRANIEGRKKRAKELGLSIYEYAGFKAAYERKKTLTTERIET